MVVVQKPVTPNLPPQRNPALKKTPNQLIASILTSVCIGLNGCGDSDFQDQFVVNSPNQISIQNCSIDGSNNRADGEGAAFSRATLSGVGANS